MGVPVMGVSCDGVPVMGVSCGDGVPVMGVSCGDGVPVMGVSCGDDVPVMGVSCGDSVPVIGVSCGDGVPVMGVSWRGCSLRHRGTNTVMSRRPRPQNHITASCSPRQENTFLLPWLRRHQSKQLNPPLLKPVWDKRK